MAEIPPPVIIAKNVLVWLSQLSAAFQRSITTLDAVPDQELDLLAERGFTVLWLIGVWERSPASASLKVQSGFRGETASPYAIRDYKIDPSIGGRFALESLKRKCRYRGIRLGCDYVPNHEAMDSRWMREHPEWFIASPEPPFPNYRYTGHNLSQDNDTRIYVEDGYADQSDAAVTFRYELPGRDVSYVYHGNDGTKTPWNDTAQLDLSQEAVRKALADRLITVAAMFPVIRIDAAMLTARDQFRRLWFPTAEDRGSIPSRPFCEKADFDRRFPAELWPDAIERLNAARPETLIIGEVMWTMEQYFLDEMGFYAVYDNEDMPSLKTGDISALKRHLTPGAEGSREQTDRFVRFLQNPDDRPVAETMGTGNRYMSICTVMATLPGIPLFGHGQIEGSRSRYSMSASRHDAADQPDLEVILNHEELIFPLLRRRELFQSSHGFRLLEFKSNRPNAQVLCYENTSVEPAVCAYNDSDEAVDGRIVGASCIARSGNDDEFVACQDLRTGDRKILSCRSLDEEGISVHLEPYGSVVYTGFKRTLHDRSGLMHSVSRFGGDRQRERLSETSTPLLRGIASGLFRNKDFRRGVFRAEHSGFETAALRSALVSGCRDLESLASDYTEIEGSPHVPVSCSDTYIAALAKIKPFCALDPSYAVGPSAYFRRLYGLLPHAPAVLASYATLYPIYRSAVRIGLPASGLVDGEAIRPLGEYLRTLFNNNASAIATILLPQLDIGSPISEILKDGAVMGYLKINSFEGELWLEKDRFGDLLWWKFSTELVSILSETSIRGAHRRLSPLYQQIMEVLDAAEQNDYQYNAVLRFIDDSSDRHPSAGSERPRGDL